MDISFFDARHCGERYVLFKPNFLLKRILYF